MYECPNCNANLKFDILTQKLLCEYCGTSIDPYAFEKAQDAEVVERDYEVTIFSCPQCGGEILSTDTTAATFCSFCGGSTILDSRLSQERRPDYIIPFKKTKNDCKKAYAKMVRKAWFAPKEFKDEESISRFRSIYMPYWVYSFEKNDTVNITGSISHQSGDFKITHYYKLESQVEARYNGIAFDAASSFSDDLSNAIAPFDFKEAKPFSPSFLSGFYADTDDVGAFIYEEDAETMVTEELCRKIKEDPICKKYTLTNTLELDMKPNHGQKKLAMFPVWFLTYRKDDRVSYAVVNGQTGEAAGDIPVDKKKYVLGSLLLAIPIFFFLNAFLSLRAPSMLGLVGGLAALCAVISVMQTQELENKEYHIDDKGLRYYRKSKSEFWASENQNSSITYKISTGTIVAVSVLLLSISYVLASTVRSQFLVWIYALLVGWCRFAPLVLTKNENYKIKGKQLTLTWVDILRTVWKPAVGVGLSVFLSLLHPAWDWFYYIAALITMALISWNVLDIMDRHNLLTTRELPQFYRRGGDENYDR